MDKEQHNNIHAEIEPQHRLGYPGSLAGQTEANRSQASIANRFAEREAEIKSSGIVAATPEPGKTVAAVASLYSHNPVSPKSRSIYILPP